MDTSKDQPTAAVANRDITDRQQQQNGIHSEEDEEESISSSSSNTEGEDNVKNGVRHHMENQKEMPHGSLPLNYQMLETSEKNDLDDNQIQNEELKQQFYEHEQQSDDESSQESQEKDQQVAALEEKSKTTYESCSSYNSSGDGDKEVKAKVLHQSTNKQQLFVKRNIALDLDQQSKDQVPLSTPQNCYSDAQHQPFMVNPQKSTTSYQAASRRKSQQLSNQSHNSLSKTQRLKCLREDGKLIHFEEYDPQMSNPYALHTGGCHNSQSASNSNRFSFSKTFNFNMPLNQAARHFDTECLDDEYGEENQHKQDNYRGLKESQNQVFLPQKTQKDQNELTHRLDEKIKQISEEYNNLLIQARKEANDGEGWQSSEGKQSKNQDMNSRRGQMMMQRDGLFPQRFSLMPNSAREQLFSQGSEQPIISARGPQLQNYRQFGGDSARGLIPNNQRGGSSDNTNFTGMNILPLQSPINNQSSNMMLEEQFSRSCQVSNHYLRSADQSQNQRAQQQQISHPKRLLDRVNGAQQRTPQQTTQQTQGSGSSGQNEQFVRNTQSREGDSRERGVSQTDIIINNKKIATATVLMNNHNSFSSSNSQSQAIKSIKMKQIDGQAFLIQDQEGSDHHRQWCASEDLNNVRQKFQIQNKIPSFAQDFNRTVPLLGFDDFQNHNSAADVQQSQIFNQRCAYRTRQMFQMLMESDEQILLYQQKIQDITAENAEFKQRQVRMNEIEQENIYLRSMMANTDRQISSNSCQTDQASFPIEHNHVQSIALSPFKFQDDSIVDLEQRLDQSQQEILQLQTHINESQTTIKLLEKECRSLKHQLINTQSESDEIKYQMQLRSDQTSARWQQIEDQHRQILDHEHAKIEEINRILEEQRVHSKRKSGKIKALKKERDSLRIEILKMKQMFSEKCDNYREGRVKLQNKVKKRDDKIAQLVDKLCQYERILMQKDMEAENQPITSHRRIQYHQDQQQEQRWVDPVMNKQGQEQLEQSQNIALRSSVSSRSLENTRNLNTTSNINARTAAIHNSLQQNAPNFVNNLRNNVPEQYQRNQNFHDAQISSGNLQQRLDISLNNPPKVRNLAPGSLPSGNGVRSSDRTRVNEVVVPLASDHNQIHKAKYPNQPLYDNVKDNPQNSFYAYQNQGYQNQDFNNEVKSYNRPNIYQQGKLEYGHTNVYDPQDYHQKPHYLVNQHTPNNLGPRHPITQTTANYVSNEKSKSFYSSDLDKNPLFDNQQIVSLESNSSNFFSNVNNSNSHIMFMDESTMGQYRQQYRGYGYNPNYLAYRNQEQVQRYRDQMNRIASNQNMMIMNKPYQDKGQSQPQPNYPIGKDEPKKRIQGSIESKKQTGNKMISLTNPRQSHPQQQTIQHEINDPMGDYLHFNYAKLANQLNLSKSPLEKNSQMVPLRNQPLNNVTSVTYQKTLQNNVAEASNIAIQKIRSTQSLQPTLQQQQQNTSSSQNLLRNDSMTSSNKNLNTSNHSKKHPSNFVTPLPGSLTTTNQHANYSKSTIQKTGKPSSEQHPYLAPHSGSFNSIQSTTPNQQPIKQQPSVPLSKASNPNFSSLASKKQQPNFSNHLQYQLNPTIKHKRNRSRILNDNKGSSSIEQRTLSNYEQEEE